jgi:hypothetical protein
MWRDQLTNNSRTQDEARREYFFELHNLNVGEKKYQTKTRELSY